MDGSDDIETLFRKAVEQHNRGRLIDALVLYDAIIRLDPNIARVHSNRGAALSSLQRFEDALQSFDRAVELEPDYAQGHNNKANALGYLKRPAEAVLSYDRAIALEPDYAEAYFNRGNALKALKRLDEALRDYDRAISLKPDFAEAHNNRANTLRDLQRWEEALESYDKAIALKPGMDFVLDARLYAKLQLCDFANLESETGEILSALEQGKKACAPFQLLAISGSPELQRRGAEIYVAAQPPSGAPLPAILRYPDHGKIRLGYFSADFHDHATMHLMAGLFERHDRSKFETIAFSFGPDRNDGMRARVTRAFDRFVDVRDRTDEDVAGLSRSLEVDIAIDLKGFTQDNRAGIFACRAAPIQVNYLGYPGTMGAGYMDYIV
ncbi:MAG: tetratricopeptide repeat protein, partial [Rhizomicrobium sp.]